LGTLSPIGRICEDEPGGNVKNHRSGSKRRQNRQKKKKSVKGKVVAGQQKEKKDKGERMSRHYVGKKKGKEKTQRT